jgi:HK97 family phage portal protein
MVLQTVGLRIRSLELFGKRLIGKALPGNLQAVSEQWHSWWPFSVLESTTGAWQRNEEVRVDIALRHPTAFRCVTLIQTDIGKMRIRLEEEDANGVSLPVNNPAYSPVLRRPNHYQNRQQFIESWMNSKLIHGNTYALKQRDGRGVVSALYLLEPGKVKVLEAPDGSVFYELSPERLPRLEEESVVVPAREIIHDRMPALFHPLVGVSPFYAASAIANQGLNIQDSSNQFYANGAQPGGILQTDRAMKQDTADRVKAYWETAFSGSNAGKVAILADGLKYKQVDPLKASDAQLVEQLNWIDEKICSCFGMPPHKVGVGDQPNYNNIEALNQQYYSECLQPHITSIQELLAHGLETRPYTIAFDLTDLMRMDTATMVKAASEGIRAGFLAPNEARRIFFGLPHVDGGDTPYLQHQDYSLEALARRDSAAPAPPSGGAVVSEDEQEKAVTAAFAKMLVPA